MVRKCGIGLAVFAITLLAPIAFAQSGHEGHEMTPEQQAEMEAYMKAGTPGAPHAHLASIAGTYTVKVKNWPEPGAPPMESTGSATRKMILGGRVMVEDFSGSMMGMPFTGQGMTGFDNVSQKYWATWTDSMSTGMMLSEGTCDASHACTYQGSWNDPIKKSPVKSRMTLRWLNPTTEVFEMYGPDKTGKETKMMELTYTKQ